MKGKTLEDTRFWRGFDSVQKVILIVTNLSAALIVACGVFMRYVLHTDFFGQEEVITVVAMWLYFVGGIRGSFEESHIQADIIKTMLHNEKIKKVISISAQVLTVVVLAFLAKWSADYGLWSIKQGATSMGLKIPLIFSQSALAIGFIIMFLLELHRLYRLLFTKKHKDAETTEPAEEGGAA